MFPTPPPPPPGSAALRTLSLPQGPPARSKSEQQVTLPSAATNQAQDLEAGAGKLLLLPAPNELVVSAIDIPSAVLEASTETDVANKSSSSQQGIGVSKQQDKSSSADDSGASGGGHSRRRQRRQDGTMQAITSSDRNNEQPPSLELDESKRLLGADSRAPKESANKQQQQQQQQQRQRRTRPAFINPSGRIYYWWSAVISLAFLYNFWAASYRFAFQEINPDTAFFWIFCDALADLLYIVDFCVHRRTAYLEDGVLQRDREKIVAHYGDSNYYYLDLFCVLPFDILYMSFGYISILRCNRLVKIYRFFSFLDRTERHTNYPNLFRTSTLVHNILVIFHWNACIFHMISMHKIIDIEGLQSADASLCKDTTCQYLRAFYWSTLAIIGNLPRPRTSGEYVYVIAELILGLILFAWVLGHVANIVTNVSAARKEFQARLDAVKTFMRTRRVSDDLQTKVIRWFDYLWSSQKSSDEERSVACLPDRLKAEIAIHVNLDTLKRVDIFQETEVGFLRELVLRLKPVLFSPGDYVCRKDEAGHEMYIVSRGILEVVTNNGQTVVATFTAGSYFGEIAVLNVGSAGNKRTASVRSVGYSDLFCLSKQDLWDVLKDYPLAEARIRAVAEERLSALGGSNHRHHGANNNEQGGQKRELSRRRSRESRTTGLIEQQQQQQRQFDNGAVRPLSSLPPPPPLHHDHQRRFSQRSSRGRYAEADANNDNYQDARHNNRDDDLEETTGTGRHSFKCCALPVEPSAAAAAAARATRARQSSSARSYNAARTSSASASQTAGRKCLNSRTMEPISAMSVAALAPYPFSYTKSNPAVINPGLFASPATTTDGRRHASGSPDLAGLSSHQHQHQHQHYHCQQRQPQRPYRAGGVWCADESACPEAHCRVVSSPIMRPPAGLPRTHSNQPTPTATRHQHQHQTQLRQHQHQNQQLHRRAQCSQMERRMQLLDVQSSGQMNQSRSFECSPLGGVVGANESHSGGGGGGGGDFPQLANRSRSGAIPTRSVRNTPPQTANTTSDENQPISIEQAISLDGYSTESSARRHSGMLQPPTDSMNRQRKLVQHSQVISGAGRRQVVAGGQSESLSSLGHTRGRSNSMTDRPTRASESSFGCDDDEVADNENDYDDDFVGDDADDDCDDCDDCDDDCDDDDDDTREFPITTTTRLNDNHWRQPDGRAGGSCATAGMAPAPQTGARQRRHRRDCRHHHQQQHHQEHSHNRTISTTTTTGACRRASVAGGRRLQAPPYGQVAGGPPAGSARPPAHLSGGNDWRLEAPNEVAPVRIAASGPSTETVSDARAADRSIQLELDERDRQLVVVLDSGATSEDGAMPRAQANTGRAAETDSCRVEIGQPDGDQWQQRRPAER